METTTKRMYEALFLVDSSLAAGEWDTITQVIEKMIQRREGEVVSIRKWDDRRLAYEIKGRNRGTYILVYFHGEPRQISAIERDVQLSEQLMRVMILNAENIPTELIEHETPAMMAERQQREQQEAQQQRQAEAEAAEAQKKAEQEAEEAEKVQAETPESAEEEKPQESAPESGQEESAESQETESPNP